MCSHVHILSEKRPFSKITCCFFPYFVKITAIPSKARCSHVIFFRFFMKNPQLSSQYLIKKTSILSKLHYNIIIKKVKRMPFFSYFPRKNHCSYAHILSKKRPFYKNYAALMPIFCQKTFILSRIHCSHVIFFHFSMKNLLSIPYLVKNTSILSKLPYIMGQKSYRMPFFS